MRYKLYINDREERKLLARDVSWEVAELLLHSYVDRGEHEVIIVSEDKVTPYIDFVAEVVE